MCVRVTEKRIIARGTSDPPHISLPQCVFQFLGPSFPLSRAWRPRDRHSVRKVLQRDTLESYVPAESHRIHIPGQVSTPPSMSSTAALALLAPLSLGLRPLSAPRSPGQGLYSTYPSMYLSEYQVATYLSGYVPVMCSASFGPTTDPSHRLGSSIWGPLPNLQTT